MSPRYIRKHLFTQNIIQYFSFLFLFFFFLYRFIYFLLFIFWFLFDYFFILFFYLWLLEHLDYFDAAIGYSGFGGPIFFKPWIRYISPKINIVMFWCTLDKFHFWAFKWVGSTESKL